MSFQRFSLHHTFLDGLRSSLDMTMDGRRRHPQNSNITPAVHVLPRHNPDHPLAGERQEFRTRPVPFWPLCFSDGVQGPIKNMSLSCCRRMERLLSQWCIATQTTCRELI